MHHQSGGIFWAVEGAVLIGYPQASKVGRYLGVWLAWRNAGSLIGASINLGLNIKTSGAGSLSPSTYVSGVWGPDREAHPSDSVHRAS
jgi:hypothetical protein